MERAKYFGSIFRVIAFLLVSACIVTPSTEAIAAPCRTASGTIGYYLAKNYFGVARCDGVEARPAELLELCRNFLGATSRAHVTYGRVLTGDFRSPDNNTQCEFVPGTDRKRLVPADHSLNAVVVDCYCKQCADGIDNDGDGATDFPSDFSCSSEEDNDETNPKQCEDGIDNDSDRLVDLNDPGCTNSQGNNEGRATSQCQDGIDNDRDGAKDFPLDKSCSSKTDHSELFPRTQCNDGIDNDRDGAGDLFDRSCAGNKQNDNEALPRTKCQDVIDNDGDGLIDLSDPDCRNSRQTDTEGIPRIGVLEEPQDRIVRLQNVRLRGVLDTARFSAFAIVPGVAAGGLQSDLNIQWQERKEGSNCPDRWCDMPGKVSHDLSIPISPLDAPLAGRPNIVRRFRARFSYEGLTPVTTRDASLTIKPPAPPPPARRRLVCSRPADVVLGADNKAKFTTTCSVNPPYPQLKYYWTMMQPEITGKNWVRVFEGDRLIPEQWKSPLREEFEIPLDLSFTPEFVAGLGSGSYYRAVVVVPNADGRPDQTIGEVATDSARLLLPNQTAPIISLVTNLEDVLGSQRPTFTVQASINVRPTNAAGDRLRFVWQVRNPSAANSNWVTLPEADSPWARLSSTLVSSGPNDSQLWESKLEIDMSRIPGLPINFADSRIFRVIVKAPGTDAPDETSQEARFFLPPDTTGSSAQLEVGAPNVTVCALPSQSISVDAIARINLAASTAPVAFTIEYRDGENGTWAEVPRDRVSTWRSVSHQLTEGNNDFGTLWGASAEIATSPSTPGNVERWIGYQYRVIASTSLEGVLPVASVEQGVRVRSCSIRPIH